jgi:hypothetical protein
MEIGKGGNFMRIYMIEEDVEEEKKEMEGEMFGILCGGSTTCREKYLISFPSSPPPISNVMSAESQ